MAKKFKDLKSQYTRTSTGRSRINESTWDSYRAHALNEALDEEPLDVPTPEVDEIAKKHGVSVAEIEAQLKMGIKVEAEHTTHPDKAREIALDHLSERPDYYTRLKEMEKKPVKEASGEGPTGTKLPGHEVFHVGTPKHRGNHMGSAASPEKVKRQHQALTGNKVMTEEGFDSSFYEDGPHPGYHMHFQGGHHEHQYHGYANARKARDLYAAHLRSKGHKVKKTTLRNQLLHGMYGNVYSVHYNEPMKEAYDVAFNESGSDYKVGDRVIPKIGPHKGLVHKVIHVHDTGHLNIQPVGLHAKYVRYHLGAAKAHPNDVERAPLKEAVIPPPAKKNPKDKTKFVPDPKIWKKMPALSKLLNVKLKEERVVNRITVQEVFKAAVDKKKTVDNLPNTDGAKEQNKQVPDQKAQKKEAPGGGVPLKKGQKLDVKGAGVDEKFQKDPIVTPITTMAEQRKG